MDQTRVSISRHPLSAHPRAPPVQRVNVHLIRVACEASRKFQQDVPRNSSTAPQNREAAARTTSKRHAACRHALRSVVASVAPPALAVVLQPDNVEPVRHAPRLAVGHRGGIRQRAACGVAPARRDVGGVGQRPPSVVVLPSPKISPRARGCQLPPADGLRLDGGGSKERRLGGNACRPDERPRARARRRRRRRRGRRQQQREAGEPEDRSGLLSANSRVPWRGGGARCRACGAGRGKHLAQKEQRGGPAKVRAMSASAFDLTEGTST